MSSFTKYQRNILTKGAEARESSQPKDSNPYWKINEMHAYHLWAAGWEDSKQFNTGETK